MKNKRFTKGQIVYQVCSRLTSNGKVDIAAVVERQVDACGEKQMTFYDRGGHGDFVFGRQLRADWPYIFATREEAAACIKSTFLEPHDTVFYPGLVLDYRPDFEGIKQAMANEM